jgi:hypothetical protein
MLLLKSSWANAARISSESAVDSGVLPVLSTRSPTSMTKSTLRAMNSLLSALTISTAHEPGFLPSSRLHCVSAITPNFQDWPRERDGASPHSSPNINFFERRYECMMVTRGVSFMVSAAPNSESTSAQPNSLSCRVALVLVGCWRRHSFQLRRCRERLD